MDELRVHIYSLWHFSWARKSLVSTMPDEETLAEQAKQANGHPVPTTAQVMSPSGAAPGTAPIYPPAPPQLPPTSALPSVNHPIAPGGRRPIVPHAPSRYANYTPQPDPYAPFDYAAYNANPDPARYGVQRAPPVTLPNVPGEGHSLAALAALQPDVFGPYWAQHQDNVRQQQIYQQQQQEWQAQQQQQYFALQQQEQQRYFQQQQHYHYQQHAPAHASGPSFDEELALYMQEQLHLQERQERGQQDFGQAGPSSRPNHY